MRSATPAVTERMRILLLNYEFPPVGGGAGHASYHIAQELVDLGHRVDVVTSGAKGQPTEDRFDGMLTLHRVRSWRSGVQECGIRGAWSYVAAAQPVVRKLLTQHHYDVIHYFFGLPTGLLSLCTPGARLVPSVISLRGSDVPGYDAECRTLRVAHWLLSPLTRKVWESADVLVANSFGLRSLAQPVLPTKSIEVIRNAIDCTMFFPNGAIKRRTNGHGKTTRILTVARLIGRKGLDDLLKAMASLKNEDLTLTIQGWGRDSDRLRKLSERLGIDRQVIFAGFKERYLLPEVYRAADVFVLPSHSESCSMALLEAMACGLPVVATDVGGTSELVKPGINGRLVSPSAPRALADALRTLINDPSELRAIGQRNAREVRQSYSWEKVTGEYLDLYRQAIRRRHSREGSSGRERMVRDIRPGYAFKKATVDNVDLYEQAISRRHSRVGSNGRT